LEKRHVLGDDDVEAIAGPDLQSRRNVHVLGDQLRGHLSELPVRREPCGSNRHLPVAVSKTFCAIWAMIWPGRSELIPEVSVAATTKPAHVVRTADEALFPLPIAGGLQPIDLPGFRSLREYRGDLDRIGLCQAQGAPVGGAENFSG
jgi:hypothetical protein